MLVHDSLRFDLHGHTVNDTSLLSICRSNPKELLLSSCPNVSDRGVAPLFESGELRFLSITLCPNLTDLTLELIASYLRKLQGLELSDQIGLSDHRLSMLLASCPELTSLSINQCQGLTDNALFSISLFGQQIRSLRLSGNSGFTEKGFAFIPRGLENLNISSNIQVSDALCQDLVSTSRHLTFLDASFCSRLTHPIFSTGPDLSIRILNLQGCTLIGDSGLEAASTRCRSLTHLYLAYSSITDKGLESLSENTPKLKVLDLSRCSRITDAGIKKILQSCRGLEQLNVLNCPLLSEKYQSFLKETA